MHFTKFSFDDYLKRVAILIGNSLGNSAIMGVTSHFGYDVNRIKEGECIFNDAVNTNEKQNQAQEKKVQLHNERCELHLAVKKKYMKILQISRIAFDKDLIIRKALRLDGAREVTLDLWINQVSLFTNHLLGESKWLSVLKNFGVVRKDIHDLLTELEKLRSVTMECEIAKNEAKQFTVEKHEKLKELQEWVSDYLKIAKIALDDQPEMYKKLIMDN